MSVCCHGTLANHGVWVWAGQPVDEQPQDLSESGKGPSPAKLPDCARDLSTYLSTSKTWTVYTPEETMPRSQLQLWGSRREERSLGTCFP